MSTKTAAGPRCNHDRDVVIVTNQPDRHDSRRTLLMAWVCGTQACVIDAMAWVESFTGEPAYWRIGPNHEGRTWHSLQPREDVTR